MWRYRHRCVQWRTHDVIALYSRRMMVLIEFRCLGARVVRGGGLECRIRCHCEAEVRSEASGAMSIGAAPALLRCKQIHMDSAKQDW